MAVIERRYAEALLAVAGNPAEADHFDEGLADLRTAFLEDPDVRHFFTASDILPAVKREAVERMFPREEWRLLVNFLLLLIDKNRIGLLPEMHREYRTVKNERQNHLEIKLFSALPLPESQTAEIAAKYRAQYGAAAVSVSQTVNPALLGGVLVQIGDIRIDGTQLGRLKALRHSIQEEAAWL